MQWGDGLRVNPGTLSSTASRLESARSSAEGQLRDHAALDFGSWRGDARTRHDRTHQRIVERGAHHVGRMAPAASALSAAATAFHEIQAAQTALVQRAAASQFAIDDGGNISSTSGMLSNLDPRRWVEYVRLFRSVIAAIARLNGTDVMLASRLAGSDLMADGKGKLMDGQDWLEDAGDWLSDVGDDLGDRLGHAKTAFDRLMETWGQKPQWLKDFEETGEWPQLAELGGQALFELGQFIGIPANFIAGEDLHFFDDGDPFYADSVEARGAGPKFESINDVIHPMMDVYNTHDPSDTTDRAQIQVTAVTDENDVTRYVVSIPGTTESLDEWRGWNGDPGGTDWPGNFKGVGYGSTAATESVKHAIDLAIAEHRAQHPELTGTKPEVLLTGHSQGGIIAGNIANDEAFRSQYDVAGIISAGSPVDSLGVPEDIPIYNYRNQLDPVPRVDFGGLEGQPANVTEIEFAHEGSIWPTHTHLQQTYQDNISALHEEAQSGSMSENAVKQRQLDADLGRFYKGESESYRVRYGRQTERDQP